MRPPARCGTDGGYYRHLRTLGEPACPACLKAHADAKTAREARRRGDGTLAPLVEPEARPTPLRWVRRGGIMRAVPAESVAS